MNRMIEEGVLKTINARKPGAKKFFARFDSKHVNEVARDNKPEIKVRAPKQPEPTSVNGVMTTLARIETKVDRLIAMWG